MLQSLQDVSRMMSVKKVLASLNSIQIHLNYGIYLIAITNNL